jgi:hypothetical protein
MNDTVTKLMGMVDRYWDLAYAEGAEGRTHDTPTGDAAETRQVIQDELVRLFTQDSNVVGLAIDLAEHGLTEIGDE